jgi:hypothetical protein
LDPAIYGPYGALVLLGLAVAALWRAHTTSDYEMRVDRDFWRDLALRGTELADKATTVAIRKR